MKTVLLLAALLPAVRAQSSGSTCLSPPPSYFTAYKIETGAYSTNSTICPSLYSTLGTCTNITSNTIKMNNLTSLFRFNSVNTLQFIKLLTNVTLYWKAANGFVNGPITEQNTLLNSISQTWDGKKEWLSGTPDWLRTLEAEATNSIQKCNEVYANASLGLWCHFTANQNLTSAAQTGPMADKVPYKFPTSSLDLAVQLDSCLPLLDVYCLNTYGVSISYAQEPFNTTFNFTDNTVPIDICLSMRSLKNQTAEPSVRARRMIMMNLFNTLRIIYSPDYNSLKNYAYFLLGGRKNTSWSASNATVNLLVPGAGVYFNESGPNVSFVDMGVNSGIKGMVYGQQGAGRAAAAVLLALLGLIWQPNRL